MLCTLAVELLTRDFHLASLPAINDGLQMSVNADGLLVLEICFAFLCGVSFAFMPVAYAGFGIPTAHEADNFNNSSA